MFFVLFVNTYIMFFKELMFLRFLFTVLRKGSLIFGKTRSEH